MDKHFFVYYRRPLCSEISVSMILIHIARNVSMLVRAFTLMPLIVSRAWFCSQSCKTVCLCHNVVVTRFLWNLVLNQIMVRIMGGVVVVEKIYQLLSYQYSWLYDNIFVILKPIEWIYFFRFHKLWSRCCDLWTIDNMTLHHSFATS